jgi:hypothetical protein
MRVLSFLWAAVLALVFSGSLKIWSYVEAKDSQDALAAALQMRCSPIPLEAARAPVLMAAHCWGCYAVAAGLAMGTALVLQNRSLKLAARRR